MSQNPGPKREKSSVSQPSHSPGWPPRPSAMSLRGAPTMLFRKDPLLAKEPTSQPPGQNFRYTALPPLPAPHSKQDKSWQYQNSLAAGVTKLCSDPVLPLTTWATLSRSAASPGFSPLICLKRNFRSSCHRRAHRPHPGPSGRPSPGAPHHPTAFHAAVRTARAQHCVGA